MRLALATLLFGSSLFFLACGGDSDPGTCMSTSDCPAGRACRDGMCVLVSVDSGPTDGGGERDMGMECPDDRSCRGGSACCAEGEECVDGLFCFAVCENTRCGDNGMVCCDSGETCLDGVVCAADCGADEALCGTDLELCCPAGDACVADACVTPGIECMDDFDCRDEALYCEPTIGRCLPTPGGPTCELRPEFEDVEVIQEWHWPGIMVGGSFYSHVITTPVTGDVSGDGIPDVVVPAYTGTTWHDPILVGISGDDGTTLWTIARDGATTSAEGEGVALANFDPTDDALEVAYRLDSGGFRIVDGDGSEIVTVTAGNLRGTIEVAEINGDGTPDLVLGCRAFDGSDPATMLWNVSDCGSYGSPSIADLDLDGEPEVTSGGVAVNADGSILWGSAGGNHALTAIADVDADGTPEVVTVRAGQVDILVGATGARWAGLAAPLAIPGGGTGGAPTVADFDGDGLPEISSAGRAFYTVYDVDCLEPAARTGGECNSARTDGILWSVATQDLSSSVTGSSVFDFQGDGVAEVIYNDECFLHIYDGLTGRELLSEPVANSSRTGYEYPTVVDVDGDGNSEIVVGANSDQAVGRDNCDDRYREVFGAPVPPEFANGTTGVFSYGDPGDRGVGTRAIWHRFSYHVTNVGSDGSVPAVEANNWEVAGLNNYRQNVQGSGIFNAPNLIVTLTAVEACGTGEVRLSAVVENAGSRGVPAGVTVEFVRTDTGTDEVVGSANTTGALLPGGSERLTLVVTVPVDVDLTYEARVDGASGGSIPECNEDDNTAAAMARCPSFG